MIDPIRPGRTDIHEKPTNEPKQPTTMLNRYARGQAGRPILLQARDRDILTSIFRHRWMRADQIQRLHFPNASDRACRERVRRLWLAHLIDRKFLPLALVPHGGELREAYAGSAVYCLARAGAGIVADRLRIDSSDIPQTLKANRRGYKNLEHNLVATDFFVALEAGSGLQSSVRLAGVDRETALWQRLRERSGRAPTRFVVPDGAATLFGTSAKPTTFYIEVVRSDPKGGSRALLRKLGHYVELNRSGFFRDTWGHGRVRAVVILTPTKARSENIRRLAKGELTYGRSLFWFGSYEASDQFGRRRTNLLPENILGPRFRSIDGRPQSINSALQS